MSAFGIDFGTTNSLAAVVSGNRAISLVDAGTQRPHASVLWYRGAEVVVGREARQHLDITDGGAAPGFVRSPKMRLRREGPIIFVEGRPVDPTDAVAEVLKHLKQDAGVSRDRARGHVLDRAVMTIPVDFGGPERRALRQAARKAGIGVIQFVHEPVAALYAYLRAQPEFRRELARLEGRSVLVFDWGGGTLDLTLCRIQGGSIVQVASMGDNEIGGDEFDNRIRNLLREHAAAHGLEDVTALEQPGMAAKLLDQCEFAKIRLSEPKTESTGVIIRNFLKHEGPAQNLVDNLTRAELDKVSANIVVRGLAKINDLLDQVRLTYQDVELCLATGGMVNMPAIQRGLTERFLGRVPRLPNGDRIIAEGAAWIAHDGLRLTLAKPIEILVADSSGRGSYYPLVAAGLELPVENQVIPVANSRLFCVDPREGEAVIEFAKPIRTGTAGPSDPRCTLSVATVPVSPEARPLLERIECQLQIDHDYVATVCLRATGRGTETRAEFHDLDFGLSLPRDSEPSDGDGDENVADETSGPASLVALETSNVTQRTNVTLALDGSASDGLWRLVPGDIVANWRPNHFDTRSAEASERQQDERYFYVPCARCRRLISQINAEGPVEACRGRPCGATLPPGVQLVAKAAKSH